MLGLSERSMSNLVRGKILKDPTSFRSKFQNDETTVSANSAGGIFKIRVMQHVRVLPSSMPLASAAMSAQVLRAIMYQIRSRDPELLKDLRLYV